MQILDKKKPDWKVRLSLKVPIGKPPEGNTYRAQWEEAQR